MVMQRQPGVNCSCARLLALVQNVCDTCMWVRGVTCRAHVGNHDSACVAAQGVLRTDQQNKLLGVPMQRRAGQWHTTEVATEAQSTKYFDTARQNKCLLTCSSRVSFESRYGTNPLLPSTCGVHYEKGGTGKGNVQPQHACGRSTSCLSMPAAL